MVIVDNSPDTGKKDFEKIKKKIVKFLKDIRDKPKKKVKLRVIFPGVEKPIIDVKRPQDVKRAIKVIKKAPFNPKPKKDRPKKPDTIKRLKDVIRKSDPKKQTLVLLFAGSLPKKSLKPLMKPAGKNPPTVIVHAVGELRKKPKTKKRLQRLVKAVQPKSIQSIVQKAPKKGIPSLSNIVKRLKPQGESVPFRSKQNRNLYTNNPTVYRCMRQ